MKDAMKDKRVQLKTVLGELDAVQKRMAEGETLTQPEAEAADRKAEEAEALQKEIDAHDARVKRIADAQEKGRKIQDPTLPPDNQLDDPDDDTKGGRHGIIQTKAADGNRMVAYMRLGHYVTTQRALADFVKSGSPRTQVVLADLAGIPLIKSRHGEPLVPVSREMLQAAYEAKAVPTLGDGVIEPTRLPEIIRVTEHDRLQLRDVLDIQQTNSDAVKYTRIVSYTRAAATVAHGAGKPESPGLVMDAVTEPVKTIAVHMPIQDQQISDYPQLAGIINGELLYDVDKHIEELVMYGDGTGEDFNGIIPDADVPSCRSEAGDTLIDIARRGITDVRRAGYEPNAILVDPLDWEVIVLQKGTDNRYVWVVVTDGATQRLWAVPVIETVAMEDFAGLSEEARNLLVGDFGRGATLWDRMRSQISVGWINDQFITNQRTILAESRAAFGVKRPGAFRKHETSAASSS